MKIIACGGLTFFQPAVDYLTEHGYKPFMIIPNTEKFDTIPECDLLICIGHPQIMKKNILDIPKLGAINMHTSLLPRYRGRHPVNWAILNGEKEIGMTVHYMTEKIDEGDIILVESVYAAGKTYEKILEELIPKANDMLLTVVRQIETGTAYRRKQIPELGEYWRKRVPEDSQIFLTEEQKNKIRACQSPYQAFIMINGKRIDFETGKDGEIT